MNTEQNYVGGGNCATSTPQTAQNAAQASPTADNRQQSTDGNARTGNVSVSPWSADMLKIISEITSENSLSTYVEQITDNAYAALCYDLGAEEDRVINRNRPYEFKEHHLDALYTSLRLVTALSRMYEQQAIIDRLNKEEEVRRA